MASVSRCVQYLIFALFPLFLGVFSSLHSFREINALKAEQDKLGPQFNYIKAAYPFFILLIVVEVSVAFFSGKLKKIYRVQDGMNSIWEGSLQQMLGLFIKPAQVFPFLYLRMNYPILTLDESSWVHWIVGLVGIELMYYWFHRLSHEWNPFWAGHMVHHSSQEYNLTTALRQGMLQPVWNWMFHLPLAPFISFPMYVFHNQWNTLYQFWIHTRLVGKLWWPIEYLFNTPSHHRVHHGRNPQYIDKNYGGTLIIFDRIFGTFEPEHDEVIYGITHDLGTWNPVYHQVAHLEEMAHVAALPKLSLLDRIRVFLDHGPEFNYYAMNPTARTNPPPAITRATEVRYDSWGQSHSANVYAVVWGLLSILGAIVVLTVVEDGKIKSLELTLALLFAVVAAMTASSMVLDRSPYVLVFELVRLPLTMLLAVYLRAPQAFDSLKHGRFNDAANALDSVASGSCWVLLVSLLWVVTDIGHASKSSAKYDKYLRGSKSHSN